MIIGLGHRQGTGKDTFAKFLADALYRLPSTKSVQIMGFADCLKDICYRIYKQHGLMPGEYYETNRDARNIKLPTLDLTPRELWIKFGTDAVREIVYDNTWLDMSLQKCSRDPGHHSILKDTRFPNEATEILGAGGLLIKVTNSRAPVSDDVADTALEGFDEWDWRVRNESTLEALVSIAQGIAKAIERMEA